ncbi:hypothetical protein Bca4012_044239 [Brassica carinata]|uniref:DUF4283 domain-containing protein n=3 Tax=Brassica TaxID=3705 RepID=A0A0D3E9S8_BRAOL|nr:unnamed protein product [Brassica napus]VDD31489.1 unnamed protein product [Brassica oleracea]
MGSRFQSRSAHMADLKGKRICYEDDGAPIQLTEHDDSFVIKEYHMSLIGKILNPKKQNVEKLIQTMPHQWGLEDRITAIDLGNGKFLFNFSSEEDLNSVLRKGPFHYNYCMFVLLANARQHQGRTGVFARVQLLEESSRQPLLVEQGASDYHSRSAYMARHADNRRGYDDREGLIMRRRDGNGRTHLYGGSRQHSKPYHRNVEQRLCAKQYNGSYNMRREDPASGSQATIIPDGSDINSNSGNDQHVAQHSESYNVTVRDRGVSKSLSFSPKASGDEAIIGALSGMDLTVPQDEHMIDCEVNDDDLLGMDLMEMENGNSSRDVVSKVATRDSINISKSLKASKKWELL